MRRIPFLIALCLLLNGSVSAVEANNVTPPSETSQPAQSIQSVPSPVFAPPTKEQMDSPVFPMEDIIEKHGNENSNFMKEFLNMLATLGFIIGLMLIVAWFLKRMVNSKLEKGNASSLIKVLERRNLSPKSAVYLLEIEGTAYFIAESPSGITRISEFPIESEATPPASKFTSMVASKEPKT